MAESPPLILSNKDEQNKTPLWRAFERFKSTLDEGEISYSNQTTLTDVLCQIRDLDRKHIASSTTRRISSRVEPFFHFLDRYGRALDCLTQVQPKPSAIIWGILRVILESARSFSQYFKKLVSMVERLGHSVSLYRIYETFLDSERFQEALTAVYYDTLTFLKEAKSVFLSKGSKILFKGLWRTFDIDFENKQEAIAQNFKTLQEETTLAHRAKLHRNLSTQLEEQRYMRDSLSRIEVIAIDRTHERNEIMQWLCPIDMEAIFLQESQRRSQPCAEWFLRDRLFVSWLCLQQPRGIWITGLPGCGKTVLSTSIVGEVRQNIQNRPGCVSAFLYCQDDNLSLPAILASIMSQILAQLNSIPEHISAAFEAAKRHGRSKLSIADQPMALLEDSVRSLQGIYIIIDGLDELKDARTIAGLLIGLLERTENIQIIFLSRDIPALHNPLGDLPKISLTPALMSTDINNYITLQLRDLPLYDPGIRQIVFDKLSCGADGMFLWATLMIKTLMSATSSQEILELLHDLPTGLETIYVSILDRINKEPLNRRMIARRVILWICCSVRPLHWSELEAVLAFDASSIQMVESRKPFKSAILELCCPLIEYLPERNIFRLAHSSIREFLFHQAGQAVIKPASQFLIKEQQGHFEIAQVCLAYQIWHDSQNVLNDFATEPAFLDYATLCWCLHLSKSEYNSALHQQITDFFASKYCRQSWILRFLFRQPSTYPLQHVFKQKKFIKDWTRQDPQKIVQNCFLDWIQDIQEIFLRDRSLLKSRGRNNRFLDNLMSNISYFDKLMFIRDLSREYTMRGRLTEEERWLTDALDVQRLRFGQEHISTAWLINSLGIVYDQQQRIELSAKTQEHALSIQEANLGPDHLETIWTVNELGRIYRHLGHLERAELMHLRCLQRLRTILHPDDPQIAWTLNTLARTYRKQARFTEAIRLHNEALVIQKKLLGDMHPHYIWAMMDVAACYREQGRLEKSAEMYRKALDGRMEVLGVNHADTLWAMNNLGIVLEQMGDIDSALALQAKALRIQTELLGRHHKHTLWTVEILGRIKKSA